MITWFSSPDARSSVIAPPPSPAARAFHASLDDYAPTPLKEVPALAAELGVGSVWVKDESWRLGLPAFNAPGASWACRQVLDRHPGATLVTATDGNHGRAVARMARTFGVDATVFVPAVMHPEAERRIAGEGARVVRVDADYDETVRRAAAHVEDHPDSVLVQDTAWPGYEEVPAWIVEGYDTLLAEIDEALGRQPDLIAVPVGVGSLAEAVVRHYRQDSGTTSVLSVEPDTAACVLDSLHAGAAVSVKTAATVMAGLNCSTVSGGAWPVLRDGCDAAIAVTDDEALKAVADLETHGFSSGPSGAATLAGVRAALGVPERREELGLPDDAVIVLLSTESNQS